MFTYAPAHSKHNSTSTLIPGRGPLLQRKCAYGWPTASLAEECADSGRKNRLQTKLIVGASNDPLELEADRVADRVMAASAYSAVSSAPPHIQRFTGPAIRGTDSAPASVDSVLATSGRPLEPALRADMEQRFGHDFSRVRVHTGSTAEKSASDVSAHAYTVGHNVVFGAGRFAPETHEGRRVLAHELTHVVQQAGTERALMRVCDCAKLKARKPDPKDPLESGVSTAFPGLVSNDWCVLAPPTSTYNCYAWSVSDKSQWIDSQVDSVYGDKDGKLSFADFDAFYATTAGLIPQTAPDSNTVVALYAKGNDPQHAAQAADIQSCGSTPFTSKLGQGPLIAHDLNQLEGSSYGKVGRFYGR